MAADGAEDVPEAARPDAAGIAAEAAPPAAEAASGPSAPAAAGHEVPPHFRALPAPPPLEGSREEQKQRIREVEEALSSHKRSPCLADEQLQQLTKELDELVEALSKPSQDEPDIGGSRDEAEAEADGHKTETERRLAIKREIREIEKVLKAHKRKSCLDAKQMAEVMGRMAQLQGRLSRLQSASERAKAGKTVFLALQLRRSDSGEDTPLVVLSAADRVSLVGLTEQEASALRSRFAGGRDGQAQAASPSADQWDIRLHRGLRTVVLCGKDKATLAQEMERAAECSPHVVCLGSASLRVRGGLCAALRDFKGALVVIEEAWAGSKPEAEEEASLLAYAVGVRARWLAGAASLEPTDLPPLVRGEVLGDLRLRDVREDPALAPLLAEIEPLYQQEFDDDMAEVFSVEGVRMGLLVSGLPDKTALAKAPGARPTLLGFIVYKFWGPPLKAMSILRVAVPDRFQMLGFGRQLVRWAIERAKWKPRHECDRVSLSAIPKAINFYERLNFVPAPDEEAPPDEVPEVQGTLKMEYRYGQGPRKVGKR